MADTSIRVSEDTRRRLELARREGESLDEVIRRLTDTDRWLGFGALADEDDDTREGMARVRREMRHGFEDDLGGFDGGDEADEFEDDERTEHCDDEAWDADGERDDERFE